MIQVDLAKQLKPLGLPYKQRIPSRTLFVYGINIDASRQKLAHEHGYQNWMQFYTETQSGKLSQLDDRALRFLR